MLEEENLYINKLIIDLSLVSKHMSGEIIIKTHYVPRRNNAKGDVF
jgi:hypothetical protein